MKLKWMKALVSGALVVAAGGAAAQEIRHADDFSVRMGRATDWNVAAPEGFCRLRVWVDDRARVDVRGDQIVVRTEAGRRALDQGSVCNQPLPFHRVEDFRVTAERARGNVLDVDGPTRRNNFTGTLAIEDPQSGGEIYEVVVAWRNPEGRAAEPLAAGDPYPWYDETRACQDRVRRDFLARNEGDAYLEFTSAPMRDDISPNRERIRGEAWARNRLESRAITYECVLNERTNRVLSAAYEVRPRGRYSSLY